MSATRTTAPGPTRDPAETVCAQCGAELADDQEWCLECGSARTVIHRAPDWRVPVGVIGIVAAVLIAGFVVALLNISSGSSTPAAPTQPAAQAPAATTATNAAPATTATVTTTGHSNIAGWPVGLPGWTVVLASSRKQRVAYADAARVASAGIQVGVLNSTEHPRLAPGYWVVFSGRYPTRPDALAASTRLIGLGQVTAHPRLVGRPGSA